MRILLSNLNLLATTPGGVARLRELILTLAVQGKLVPQDPKDEPASALLKKIRAEKDRLIADKKIRRSKPLDTINESACGFVLPTNWAWERLGNLGDWGAGATPSRSNSDYYGGAIPRFKSGELTSDFISESEETVTDAALRECSLRLNQIGDVLIAMYGATIGLPPLAEQSRIVTRVAQLRRLCFELRQRLSTSQSTQAHLAEALVQTVA